jgi:thiamine phosphate synthase YjbQ (UPF0047 family)
LPATNCRIGGRSHGPVSGLTFQTNRRQELLDITVAVRGIFLAEFDGPRRRRVLVSSVGSRGE